MRKHYIFGERRLEEMKRRAKRDTETKFQKRPARVALKQASNPAPKREKKVIVFHSDAFKGCTARQKKKMIQRFRDTLMESPHADLHKGQGRFAPHPTKD